MMPWYTIEEKIPEKNKNVQVTGTITAEAFYDDETKQWTLPEGGKINAIVLQWKEVDDGQTNENPEETTLEIV